MNGLMVFKWGPAPGLPENVPVLYKKAFEEVYNINSSIVEKAAKYITSAAKFLENSN
jgi:hypothetical protein